MVRVYMYVLTSCDVLYFVAATLSPRECWFYERELFMDCGKGNFLAVGLHCLRF